MRSLIAMLVLSCLLMQCQPKIQQPTSDEEATIKDAEEIEISQESDPSFIEQKSRDGVDFYAVGNEPSWALDIFGEHMISFKSMTEVSVINTSIVAPTYVEGDSILRYEAEVESGSIIVEILREGCQDAMLGEVFPYTVKVKSKNGNMDDFSAFNGCGRYVPDYRLAGTWRLQTTSDRPLTAEETEGPPFLKFELNEMRVVGSSGCNRISGSFVNEGSRLEFPALASTRMACKGDFHDSFAQTLNSVNRYQMENGVLSMMRNDDVLLVWQHELGQ